METGNGRKRNRSSRSRVRQAKTDFLATGKYTDGEYLARVAAAEAFKDPIPVQTMAGDALRFIKQNYAGPNEDIQDIFRLAHRLIERGKNLQADRNTLVPERGPALSAEFIQRRIQWAFRKILSDEPYQVPKVVYRDGPANITFDNESQTINITLPAVQMFTVPILDDSSILLCIRARTAKDVFGSYIHHRKGTLNVANYSAEYMGGRIITDFSPNGFTKYLGRLIYTGDFGE